MSVFRARAGSAVWLRAPLVAVVLLVLALTPAAAVAAEEDDLFSDDFLEGEFAKDEETEKKDGPLVYWGVMVPIDVLLSRPIAATNTAVGWGFFVPSAAILGISEAFRAAWDVAIDDVDWYFDPGPIQTAWQICVQDPLDYAWNRPLGQLSSDF